MRVWSGCKLHHAIISPIVTNKIFAFNHHSKIFRSATDLRLSWFVYLYFAHWEQYFELNIFFKSYPLSKNSTKMKLLSIFALCARATIQVPGIFRFNLLYCQSRIPTVKSKIPGKYQRCLSQFFHGSVLAKSQPLPLVYSLYNIAKVKNYNLNVTEIRDSDFKNAFPEILYFTVGILYQRKFVFSWVVRLSRQFCPRRNFWAK